MNILLIDKHKFTREGLRFCLEKNTQFKVVGDVSESKDALEILEQSTVDVAFVDILSQTGDTVRHILSYYPSVAVIVISPVSDGRFVRSVLEEGVSGYLFNNCSEKELSEAVTKVVAGDKYYSQAATKAVMDTFGKKSKNMICDCEDLTDRELEVLYLILKEYTNQEIANKLKISLRTVDSHKRNLMKKTNSKNIAGLVLFAFKNDMF